MVFFPAEFGSDIYRQSIDLRRMVLRIPLGLDYTPEQLEEERGQIHLVGVEQGKVVAVALLQFLNEDTAKMRQVAVAPDRQSQGIGTQLVEAFEKQSRSSGHHEIVLHARANAVPFYENLGYHIEGEPFEEVGLTHWKMGKKI